MIQYPRTLNNNIYNSNEREPPPFFHSDTNTWPRSGPFCWLNPCSSCSSVTDLVVVLEFFFSFVPTPNKSLRFTKIRRSYVNRTAVVLTNHCQSYTAFLFDVRCSKWPRSFFLSCLSPMIVHLRNLFLLSTSVARRLLTPKKVIRRKDVKQLSISISKLTLNSKYYVSRRVTFSSNLHLVEEKNLECLPIL